MEFLLLFCAVPVVMGGMAVFIFLLVKGMGGAFRRISGWDELARLFPGPAVPPANVQSGSIRLGNVFYRFGARLGVMPDGLYMAFQGAYKNPPVLIPWREMKNPRSAILYLQPARRVDIGFPMFMHLTVKEPMYQLMKPYLEAQPK